MKNYITLIIANRLAITMSKDVSYENQDDLSS